MRTSRRRSRWRRRNEREDWPGRPLDIENIACDFALGELQNMGRRRGRPASSWVQVGDNVELSGLLALYLTGDPLSISTLASIRARAYHY
jgi:hypothetical protein